MKKQEEKKQDSIDFHSNVSLPNAFIDKVHTIPRGDGLCIMRFFSSLPEGSFEHSRIIVTEKLIRNFLDNTCKMLNYYPKPEKDNSQE